MNRTKQLLIQVPTYVLLAAACGLLVWLASIWGVFDIWHPGDGELGTDPGDIRRLKHLTVLMMYAPLGALLGLVISVVEPVRETGFFAAIRSSGRWMILGLLIGGLGALIGGLAGEFVMEGLGEVFAKASDQPVGPASPIPRAVGAMCLGVVLGASLGLVERLRTGSRLRLISGVAGGGVGGLLAAVVFSFLARDNEAMTVMSLMTLSACVAASVGSVSFLQTDAFLLGTGGNIFKYNKGFAHQLNADAPNLIGSGRPTALSSRTTFKIAQDRLVLREHAIVYFDPSSSVWLVARADSEATDLLVNQARVGDHPIELREGDILTVGGTRFAFQHSE